jgi:Flp pilus assembly protein TadB
MDHFMLAFLLLMGSIFLSRYVNDRAIQKLEQDKKAQLVDLFSSRRNYSTFILFGIVALFFAVIHFNWLDAFLTYVIYALSIIVYMVVNGYRSYQQLKQLQFPDFYIRAYLLSTFIRFASIIIFLFVINL